MAFQEDSTIAVTQRPWYSLRSASRESSVAPVGCRDVAGLPYTINGVRSGLPLKQAFQSLGQTRRDDVLRNRFPQRPSHMSRYDDGEIVIYLDGSSYEGTGTTAYDAI